jgi:DsbC/DsbD-like thiol-disulfide interchange protein
MSPIFLRLLGHSAALALLLGGVSAAAARAPKTSADMVKVTAAADKPDADGKQTVTITLVPESGWHVYANPVGHVDLEDAQTVVKITGKGKPEVVKIEYPAGKVEKDKIVGEYKVYQDKTEIKAVVRRAKGDTEKLEVSVFLQACDGKRCLASDTVKVTVP